MILLSDGYLANGSEPWLLPDVADLPDLAGRVRHRAERRRTARVPAVPARPGDAGPAVGDPRHAGPGAPHRRPGEGRQDRRHLLRPGQPRLHGPHPGRPRSTASPTMPDARGRRPGRRRAGARARLGLDLRPDRRGLPRRCAQRGLADRPGAPAAPEPAAANLGEVLRRLRQGGHAGDEPGPAGARCIRASYLVDAISVQPGPRPAVHGRRAGDDAARTWSKNG